MTLVNTGYVVCPLADMSCSGHGVCGGDQVCRCFPGWTGDGCHLPYCPGCDPVRGICNGTERVEPECICVEVRHQQKLYY